jgi:hypothetical protein
MKDESTAQTVKRERSPTVVALDNLIRQKLRVSDPSDPQEIAKALRSYYRAETEAMEREAAGLPFLLAPSPTAAPRVATSSQAEVDQAVGDVGRDLTTLKTSSLLKDIEPELRGWDAAIRAVVADGLNAARQGLDPRQRDVAFANRRLLGDYARVARFVGALTPNMNNYYRRLAQSLDEVSAMILVLMGEALAQMGHGGGRFLLQVTVSELQQRRDAVIFALRHLVGSTQEGFGPQEWPRGLVAYRQFLERLDRSGQSDLRALFQENNLARLMDDLIHRGAGGQADGVRALGVTAQFTLNSLRRLLFFGQFATSPESPPLVAFLSAIQLFLDAFEHAASGYRLLFIARPPIVTYGLYGLGGPDEATRLLLELIIKRNLLAELLDCYLGCACCTDEVCCQILLDKVLYDLDRAIDLYARGTDPSARGEPELRAMAFGFIIDELLNPQNPFSHKCFDRCDSPHTRNATILSAKTLPASGPCSDPCYPPEAEALGDKIKALIDDIREELWHKGKYGKLRFDFPDTQVEISGGTPSPTTGTISPSCVAAAPCTIDQFVESMNGINSFINNTIKDNPGAQLTIPDWIQPMNDKIEILRQELCMQRNAEEQWEHLLHTMAPSCIRFHETLVHLHPTRCVIDAAIATVAGTEAACPKFAPTIPPTVETSLDSIANDVDSLGGGRTQP